MTQTGTTILVVIWIVFALLISSQSHASTMDNPLADQSFMAFEEHAFQAGSDLVTDNEIMFTSFTTTHSLVPNNSPFNGAMFGITGDLVELIDEQTRIYL
ncbi:MAG: hypothetical protein KKB70_08530 [Proteobacteria bacterium]|nr:hypothetical protein [Pseudomonadota bacterium]